MQTKEVCSTSSQTIFSLQLNNKFLYQSFSEKITFLEYGNPDNVQTFSKGKLNEYLAASWPKHLEAINNLKPFLSNRKKRNLDKAWDMYCHPDRVPGDQEQKRTNMFEGYEDLQACWGEKHARKVALEKINGILKYAKPQ